MSLHYTPILDLRVKRITALNFSPEGSKLVAITSDGFLYVWDLPSGNQYRPTPGPITKNQSCCTWMNETSFLCGFQDGYVLVGTLNADCTLTICRTQWANHPLSMLSFHKSTGLLAGGGADGVKIWKQSTFLLLRKQLALLIVIFQVGMVIQWTVGLLWRICLVTTIP